VPENGNGPSLEETPDREWAYDALAERVRELAAIAREQGLAELTVEEDGVEVSVRTVGVASGPEAVVMRVLRPAVADQSPDGVATSEAAEDPGVHTVRSPMDGVYYSSPMPGAPAFVSVGDSVSAGDVVGLVEAMKIFNEVQVEVSGEVTEVLVGNEDFVKSDQALLRVRVQ